MKIRLGNWELIIRRVPPSAGVATPGSRQQSLGKKKIATSGRSTL
ncbi:MULTISPECIES: hypothetical protein [Halomonas]|nr:MULTISPECIES: hypothetical protein [Halomonas]